MFEEILPNLYAFYSPNEGSNCYLLVGKKTLLIDTSLAKNTSNILDSLSSLGFTPGAIDMVCHTHGHADHFEADSAFKSTKLRMHSYDAQYVNMKAPLFTQSILLNSDTYPKIRTHYYENEIIDAHPFKLQVIFTPGHTKGSVCFYDKKYKLLFSGDTLFNRGCGRFDLVSGNRKELLSSLEKLSFLDYDVLLPGHGNALKSKQQENIEYARAIAQDTFI